MNEAPLLLQTLAQLNTKVDELTVAVAEIRGWGRATILIGTVLGGLAGLAMAWVRR